MVDIATREAVAGWACSLDESDDASIELVVLVDGAEAGRLLADKFRPDLKTAGIGTGRHGFDFAFRPPLSAAPHAIDVRRAVDGTPVSPTPSVVSGLSGYLDLVNRERVLGWAHDDATPDTPLHVVVTVDGRVAGRVLANAYRADLVRAGVGNGRHCFEFVFNPPLSPQRHVVGVCAEDGMHDLPQSPVLLDGPDRFDDAMRAEIVAALDTAHTDADLRERILFLGGQMVRLQALRSDRASRRGERAAARQSRRRWTDESLPAPAPLPPRALVIDATLPDLRRDAGSEAVLSHARALQRLGFEVVFAPVDMRGGGADAIEALGIACCHGPYFGSVEEVLRAEGESLDLVYLHRVDCAFPYIPLVRRHARRARIVYSVADLHHLRIYRQSVIERRPELQDLARRVREQELWAARQADAVLVHAAYEASVLRQAMPGLNPHVITWDMPARATTRPFAARSGMAMLANFESPANVDAALFLVDEVLPAIRALDPSITCQLAGSALPEFLHRPHDGLRVVGPVDSLEPLLDEVRLTIAPLNYGAGLKGQVLRSLAAGVPCVCTPVAAEGLDLGPGLRSLVSSGPAALAQAVHRLHGDQRLHATCVREGLDFVKRKLNQAGLDAALKAAVLPLA